MTADFIAGFLAGAALIVAIGAQNAFVLRQGIRREHVAPIVVVCAGADALLIAAGVAGFGALHPVGAEPLTAARYGGALFLLLYGAMAARRALRPRETMKVDPSVGASLGDAMAACLSFTFLNPHVYLDTVILLGSLASQRPGDGRWAFASGAVAASFAWFLGLGYGARLLAPLFISPVAWRVLDSLIALIMWDSGLRCCSIDEAVALRSRGSAPRSKVALDPEPPCETARIRDPRIDPGIGRRLGLIRRSETSARGRN